MRQFKYKQTFATNRIKLVFPEEKSRALALASLESLKQLLPANLNIGENPDLLFNSFNAAVVNLVNANDDGMQTSTALNLYKRFVNKFCDLEHERSSIVGFIINSGLSEYMTNRMLTESEAANMNTPFNISLGSVVWPVVNPPFSDLLIESSDETSSRYHEISASWEIGFDEIQLAIGSRDLSEAQIITDPKHVDELKQYLRVNKGSGKTNHGEYIYRIIAGDAIPLGIGYTTTPAANVKGIIVSQPEKVEDAKDLDRGENKVQDNQLTKEEKETKEETKFNNDLEIKVLKIIKDMFKKDNVDNTNIDILIRNMAPLESSVAITQSNNDEKEKDKKIISQAKKDTVKNNSNMKLTHMEDITDDSLKEVSSAAVRNFIGKQISDKIDEVSTEYATKLEAKEHELKANKEASEAIQKQFEDTKKQLEELSAQLAVEKETRAQEKLQADFNIRMADFDGNYDLTDAEREVIAKNIRGLDDTQFASKSEELEVLLAGKKKKVDKEDLKDGGNDEDSEKASQRKEGPIANQRKEAGASKASIEEVLDETQEENKATPPNTPSIEKTLRDEFADAFKLEDFKINIKK